MARGNKTDLKGIVASTAQGIAQALLGALSKSSGPPPKKAAPKKRKRRRPPPVKDLPPPEPPTPVHVEVPQDLESGEPEVVEEAEPAPSIAFPVAVEFETFYPYRALTQAELTFRDEAGKIHLLYERPRTRGDCLSGEDAHRPCPWVSCRYHLAVDVTTTGLLHVVKDWDDGRPTCALDVVEAEPEGMTLEQMGSIFGLSRERMRQVEVRALALARFHVAKAQNGQLEVPEVVQPPPRRESMGRFHVRNKMKNKCSLCGVVGHNRRACPGSTEVIEPETVKVMDPTPAVPKTKVVSITEKVGTIPREEEVELARRWRDHKDKAAFDRLVKSQQGLVVTMAKKFSGVASLEDLVQEANIGVLRAVHSFDPEMGNRLSTFAVYWMRAHLFTYILQTSGAVKFGTTNEQRKIFFGLKKARRELEAAGIEPTVEALAKKLAVDEEDITAMESRVDSRDLSIDAQMTEEGSTLGHILATTAASPEDEVAVVEAVQRRKEAIRKALLRLDKREQKIIRKRFLLENPKTLAELGDEMQLSRERVRQLENRALKKIRKLLSGEAEDLAA